MAIDYNSQERGQQAMSMAFQEALTENASLRIQVKAKDLLIGEQRTEIGRLEAKLAEAGLSTEDEPPKADKAAPPKPNRRTRRASTKKAKAGNGTAEVPAAA